MKNLTLIIITIFISQISFAQIDVKEEIEIGIYPNNYSAGSIKKHKLTSENIQTDTSNIYTGDIFNYRYIGWAEFDIRQIPKGIKLDYANIYFHVEKESSSSQHHLYITRFPYSINENSTNSYKIGIFDYYRNSFNYSSIQIYANGGDICTSTGDKGLSLTSNGIEQLEEVLKYEMSEKFKTAFIEYEINDNIAKIIGKNSSINSPTLLISFYLPNLKLVNGTTVSSTIYGGTKIEVNAEVVNNTRSRSQASTINYTLYSSQGNAQGLWADSKNIKQLAPGESFTTEKGQLNIPEVNQPRFFYIKYEIDFLNINKEADENDNILWERIEVLPRDEEAYLTVDFNEFVLNFDTGSSASFNISSNTEWEIEYDKSWFDLSQANGNGNKTITVTTNSDNPSENQRTESLTIQTLDENIKRTIDIVQRGKPESTSLTVNKSTLSLASMANSSATFYVTSNTSWSVTGDKSWMHFSPPSGTGNKTLTITVDENTSTLSRSGTVTIKTSDNSISKTVTITQQGATEQKTLTVSKSSITLGHAANSSGTFNVTSNTSWSVTGNKSWIHYSPSSETGNKTVTITVDENTSTSSRSGTVTVKTSDNSISKTVTISQQGATVQKTLTVSKSSINLGHAANSSSTFNVTSNTSWSVTGDKSWMHFSPPSGTGNKTVTITVDENTSTSPRSGTVTVKTSDNSIAKTVAITQQGATVQKTLTVSESSIILSHAANSSGTFNVTSNTSWSVTGDKSWIHFSPSSYSGNKTIIITVDENTSTSSRSGTVTIKTSDNSISKTVAITQQGANEQKNLTVSRSSITLGYAANSSGTFNVTSNTSWTTSDNQNWIKRSSSSGSGNKTITVSVDENTTSSSRNGSVTVQSTDGSITRNISIIQEKRQNDQFITVTSPNNNDIWVIGEDVNTTWEDNISNNVKIELFQESNLIWTMANGTASDGSYSRSLPSNLNIPNGDNYKIKITSTQNQDIYGFSENFTISDGTKQIDIIYPLANDNFLTGSKYQVSWTCNFNGNINLELFKSSSWIYNITSTPANTHAFVWEVPSNLLKGDDYRLKASSTLYDNVYCFSDQFSVDYPVSTTIQHDFNSYSIYPNPTERYLTIDFSKNQQNYIIEVRNNIGQLLIQKESYSAKEKIDLNLLSSGIYYLKVYNKEFSRTDKIVLK